MKRTLVAGVGLAALLCVALPRVALVSPQRDTSTRDEERSRSEDGYLGVNIQEIRSRLRDAFDIPRDVDGVLVTRVERDSPAEEAGIEERDVIRTVDGREVDDTDDLTRRVRDAGAGASMTLGIWRDGRNIDLKVRLGEVPERSRFSLGWSDDDGGSPRVWSIPGHGRGMGPMVLDFSPRGRLGVVLQDLNKGIAPFFSAPDEGALVWSVEDGGPADKAGIKAGDVIVEIEGKSVHSVDGTLDLLADTEPGDEVAVTFLRKGNRQSARVELGEGSGHDLSRFARGFIGHPRDAGRDTHRSMERLESELKRLQERLSRLKKDLNDLSD